MSFLSCSGAAGLSEKILDPERGLPALMLTVSAPEGRLCMIIASMPELPLPTRRRILDYYFEQAEGTQAKNIVIGGPWQGNCLWVENIVAKQKRPFEFLTNDHLCLLAHAPDCTPVKCFQLDTGGPYSFMGVWASPRSVEQPAPKKARLKAARPVLRLTPLTPLYDKLVEDLESAAQDHSSGGAFLEYISACCFQNKLLLMDPFGNPVPTPVPLSVKMETLLQTAQKQRQLQLNRLKRRGVAHGFEPIHEMHMDPVHDMKEIYNTWRLDVESYMKASTLANHKELQSNGLWQEAHQLGKKTFSTYQFQLSGCKFLLHKLLELPLIRARSPGSAEQPAESLATSHRSAATKHANILNNLFVAYEEHKQTDQYAAATQRNKEHQAGQLRLSRQIWWDQFNYSEGRKLSDVVKRTGEFDKLADRQQKLVEDFDTRRSHNKLDKVLEMKALKPRPYRGHGTETRSTPCLM